MQEGGLLGGQEEERWEEEEKSKEGKGKEGRRLRGREEGRGEFLVENCQDF